MNTESHNFGFLLIPGFSLVALSCAIDVLRAANVEVERQEFSWSLIGENAPSVQSSSGVELACIPLSGAPDCDVIAVCGGERSHLFGSPAVDQWLKVQSRSGVKMGSVSDGAYVAASAGLFNTCKSTIHWRCQGAYRERFPLLDIRTSILEIDGNRFSCAGGTSSLDLMLHFVADSLGPAIAGLIADNYFHDVIRGDDQVMHMTSAFRFAGRDKTLSDALLAMEADLETPLQMSQLAQELGVSHRQMDRVFRRHLGTSPASHYRDMRLLRASGLLKQTDLTVNEIALCSGFHGASHLAKFFKRKFGETPLQHRRI